MLEIFLNGSKLTRFNNFKISLKFDAVASTFSFDFVYEPDNGQHAAILNLGAYPEVEVVYRKETLVKGVVVNSKISIESEPSVATAEGYTYTGVLEDCNLPLDLFPLDYNSQSLQDIAKKVAGAFDLQVEVDSTAKAQAQKPFEKVEASETETAKSFLANLAAQRNCILSHTPEGGLFITNAKAASEPAFVLNTQNIATALSFDFNGQDLNSPIHVLGQQSATNSNARQATVKNPIVKSYRPTTKKQTSGTDKDTEEIAIEARAAQLQNISFNVETDRLAIEGNILKPNKTFKLRTNNNILQPEIVLFIKEVELSGSNEPEGASIAAVMPEAFTKQPPKTIFR